MSDFWKGFQLIRPEDNEVFCIAYILHEYRMLGEPGEDYFDLLDRGYDRWGFEKSILTKAMEDSIGRDAAALWLAEYYGEEDEHE